MVLGLGRLVIPAPQKKKSEESIIWLPHLVIDLGVRVGFLFLLDSCKGFTSGEVLLAEKAEGREQFCKVL